MSSTQADGLPEGGEAPATGAGAGGGVDAPTGPVPALRPGKARVLALLAGLIAGAASWWGGESIYGRFIPPLLATGGIPSVEEIQEAARARNAGVTREAGASAALLGAALGLSLGVAGGLARSPGRLDAVAGLLGAALGALLGAAATWALMPVYFRFYNPDKDDLMLALLIQGAVAAAIGAAAGAAFGLGAGGRRGDRGAGRALIGRALTGGLLGAVAGVVAFQIVGVLAFPLDQTTKPLSTTSVSRLVRYLAVAVLGALGAAWGATQPPASGVKRPAGA